MPAFVLTEPQKRVVEILEQHGIVSPVPLEGRNATSNFGAVNFLRRVRIAAMIYAPGEIEFTEIYRKARLSAFSNKFFLEFLRDLAEEGIIEKKIVDKKDVYVWKKL